MQGFIKAVALVFVMPLLAVAAPPPAPVQFTGSAWVDVDVAGKAHVVEMEKLTKLGDVPKLAPIADGINGRLKEAIESWQFVPAMRDGAAVTTRTHVRIILEASGDGAGGMAVRIRSASTGPGVRSIDRMALQVAATRAQVEGLVRLRLAYDGNGNVLHAEVVGSNEYWRGKFAGPADKGLRKEALDTAVRAWHLSPEVVDGVPIAGTGIVTIVFCLSTGCATTPLPGDGSPDPQQFAAIDPAAKLSSNVAGTSL